MAALQRSSSRSIRLLPWRHRRGAASLIVVMVLFFIVTLVAAYASRNLLFEQRTSANQFRSTLAFEAAEAGVEWALARLNDARMNDNCTPLASAASVVAQPSFRGRYLDISGTSGAITPMMQTGTPTVERRAGCVFNGTGWVCDCPADGNPNPTVTYTGNGPFAAFWVRFVPMTVSAGVTGVIRMQVNACTRVAADCLDFNRQAESGDGLATIWTVVALRSGFTTFPSAALTAVGAVTESGGTATITNRDSGGPVAQTNADLSSSGITVQSGAGITTTGLTLNTVAGSPPDSSRWPNDGGLNFALPVLAAPATADNRMFSSVFGMWPATFEAQPGVATVNCASDCDAAAVNDAITLHPGHVIRISDGGNTGRRLRIGANIGSAAAPVVIVADPGVNIEFDSGTPTVRGLVYSRAAAWAIRGNGTIEGAAVAQGSFEFDNDNVSITYSPTNLLGARYLNGSFVKVPGGWRDMQP